MLWKKVIKYDHYKKVFPVQVCWELNANRIRDLNYPIFDGVEDPFVVEKTAFAIQENNFQKYLHPLIEFKKAPIKVAYSDHHLFLATLLTIKRRNPNTRRELINQFKNSPKKEHYDFIKDSIAEEYGVRLLTDADEKRIDAFLENESTNPDRLHDMYLNAFLNKETFTTLENIATDLLNLKSIILHCPSQSQFITSDNPGFVKCGDVVLNFGGFGGQYEFFFPLTPTTCLYLNSSLKDVPNNQKSVYPIAIEEAFVKQINRESKSVCMEQLFANKKIFLEQI